jgi:pyruvate dehydrogenase E2 component (dihydrolipoamide acetyltransferase)
MELTLPLLGDVMTEGTVARWLQPDGAEVREGEPLYEIETDKVSLTVDAPLSGRLEQVVAEGETVPVGALVGRVVASAQPLISLLPARQRGTETRATPAARRLARRLGVDLRQIGDGRRLREADVLQHAPTREAVPLAGRRKVIAERMRTSLQQTAQVTVSMEVDMTDALQLRNQLKQLLTEDRQPTITDLVIRASVLALREHPALNATLQDGQLHLHRDIHVGIAVDADDGLIVPVLHDAQTLALLTLAERTRELIHRTRDNALSPDDVQGGTFTVTSLGPHGVDFFTPILNPPQVAILGIGRVYSKLVLTAGQVGERQSMYLNFSFDHQAVDGAPAARFLQNVKRMLELPAALMVDTSP